MGGFFMASSTGRFQIARGGSMIKFFFTDDDLNRFKNYTHGVVPDFESFRNGGGIGLRAATEYEVGLKLTWDPEGQELCVEVPLPDGMLMKDDSDS
jgi:hypothetical protein